MRQQGWRRASMGHRRWRSGFWVGGCGTAASDGLALAGACVSRRRRLESQGRQDVSDLGDPSRGRAALPDGVISTTPNGHTAQLRSFLGALPPQTKTRAPSSCLTAWGTHSWQTRKLVMQPPTTCASSLITEPAARGSPPFYISSPSPARQ